MALDPNGCEFWKTGEYYATTGLNHQTRIGSFHFPGCTTVGNGTLSGTVTDGANPISGATVALGNRTTTTNAQRALLVHASRPARTPRRRPSQGGLRPGLGVDDRRSRRRHARRGTSCSPRRRKRLLHGQHAERFPARRRRATATWSRARGTCVLANPDNIDRRRTRRQPDRLRRLEHGLGRADVHADRQRAS